MLPGELLAPQFGLNRRPQAGTERSGAKHVKPADAKAARQALENLFQEKEPVFSATQRNESGVVAPAPTVIVRRRRVAQGPDEVSSTGAAPVTGSVTPAGDVAAAVAGESSAEAAHREARVFRLGGAEHEQGVAPPPRQEPASTNPFSMQPQVKASPVRDSAVSLQAAVAAAFAEAEKPTHEVAPQLSKVPRKRRLRDPSKLPTLLRHEVFGTPAPSGETFPQGEPEPAVSQAAWRALSRRLARLDLEPQAPVPFELVIDEAKVEALAALDTALSQLAAIREELDWLEARQLVVQELQLGTGFVGRE